MAKMSDLNDFLKAIADAKKADPKQKLIKQVKETVKTDLNNLFSELSKVASTKNITPEAIKKIDEMVEVVEIIEQESTPQVNPVYNLLEVSPTTPPTPEERKDSVEKYINSLPKDSHSFQQPLEQPIGKELKTITHKLKFLEQWIGKISATGPGGGEVNLRWLDDVDRPTIYDMRYLRYNEAKKKFEFAEVNPHDIVYTTHLVETPTYTVDDDDYYVGVNYDGDVTITLPVTPNSGRMVIIKDESGNAESNPITVQGTVDNDAGGFIIQINNGAIQLIYRNGWRIV
jgi:Asp-tRNA(Asn)/Glu-tRNA(Gln) amidotransferase C subunit